MKKTLIAAVLAAGAAIAAPTVFGFAQQADPQQAPATEPLGGRQAMPGMGGMAGQPMMMHRMWMRGMLMRGTPQERCIDRLARRAARLAFIETKLDLTESQLPLWNKIENAAQAELQKERQLCDALKNAQAATFVERMQRMQQFLEARLDGLKAAQPAIKTLYDALTPAQRAIIDHPFRS